MKRLRVVALDYRAAVVGVNRNEGPAGWSDVTTPIALGGGSWDAKTVLGETRVHADGSACFTVPACRPVYFQAIDDQGRAVQTMRSWSTLQPGEWFGCAGCHESKNQAPLTDGGTTLAWRAGPQPLTPFCGPPGGFSFAREIQPILDRHCTRCHDQREPRAEPVTAGDLVADDGVPGETPPSAGDHSGCTPAFSLLGVQTLDEESRRLWSDSYMALTRGGYVSWIRAQSAPRLLPPYHAGSAKSPLMVLLAGNHYGVRLSHDEMETIACWIDLLVPYCGDYTKAWGEPNAKYGRGLQKRNRNCCSWNKKRSTSSAPLS